MESAGQAEYNDVNTSIIRGANSPSPLFQRVSDGMLTVWYKHVTEFFPVQAQQFTRMILRTLELHRERNDYLQGQLDKVLGLALTSQQIGTPVDTNQLIALTGAPTVA